MLLYHRCTGYGLLHTIASPRVVCNAVVAAVSCKLLIALSKVGLLLFWIEWLCNKMTDVSLIYFTFTCTIGDMSSSRLLVCIQVFIIERVVQKLLSKM